MGNKWIWRDGELSMKEFHKLTSTKKEEYLEDIKNLPKEQRSSMDEILVNRYNIDKETELNNLLEL